MDDKNMTINDMIKKMELMNVKGESISEIRKELAELIRILSV